MKGKKKSIIYVADFETTPYAQYMVEGETRVYIWEMKDLKGTETLKGVSISSFFDALENIKGGEISCYFHNLSFDGEFILWELMRRKYVHVDMDNVKIGENVFSSIITDTGTIFKLKVALSHKIVNFNCSYRLFPNSIKEIGKMVGLEKLSETHNYDDFKNFPTLDDVPGEEFMYLENDVEILRRLIIHLDDKNMLSISASTSAYKDWRKDKYLFVKDNLVKSGNPLVNDAIEKSYRGGLTKVNPKVAGKIFDKAISFDVNSLYPSIMYYNTMPIGEGRLMNIGEECDYPKQLLVVDVLHAKVKEGFQAFIGSLGFSYTSYHYDEEFENRTLYLWKEEFELFEQVYIGNWNILRRIGFREASRIFNDYLDKWQNIKQNPSCPAERGWAKLMCNSLYGKFAMNDDRYSKVPKGIDEKTGEIIYECVESSTIYYYKPIASYITAMARVKLVSYIILNRDRFIYCDTDSIYLSDWDVPNNIPLDDKKLGYFKLEHYYNKFKAIKAKCYIKSWEEKNKETGKMETITDSAIAGLPKDARGSITFDNLADGLKIAQAKKVKMKVKGGIVIHNVDFTIKV